MIERAGGVGADRGMRRGNRCLAFVALQPHCSAVLRVGRMTWAGQRLRSWTMQHPGCDGAPVRSRKPHVSDSRWASGGTLCDCVGGRSLPFAFRLVRVAFTKASGSSWLQRVRSCPSGPGLDPGRIRWWPDALLWLCVGNRGTGVPQISHPDRFRWQRFGASEVCGCNGPVDRCRQADDR
jgi:hypothetical protein